jgi:hypothetical protein
MQPLARNEAFTYASCHSTNTYFLQNGVRPENYYYYYYYYHHNHYHPHSLLHSSLAGSPKSVRLTKQPLLIHCSAKNFLTNAMY